MDWMDGGALANSRELLASGESLIDLYADLGELSSGGRGENEFYIPEDGRTDASAIHPMPVTVVVERASVVAGRREERQLAAPATPAASAAATGSEL